MLWLSVAIIFLILLGSICLFLPLNVHVSLKVNEEIHLNVTCYCMSIRFYSKADHFFIEDFFNDYIQPFLTKKSDNKLHKIKKIHLKQLKWHSLIGLEHADNTAFSAVVLKMLKGIVVQVLISYYNRPDKMDYQVEPNFTQSGFETDCQCMFSIRLGQAIYMKLKR